MAMVNVGNYNFCAVHSFIGGEITKKRKIVWEEHGPLWISRSWKWKCSVLRKNKKLRTHTQSENWLPTDGRSWRNEETRRIWGRRRRRRNLHSPLLLMQPAATATVPNGLYTFRRKGLCRFPLFGLNGLELWRRVFTLRPTLMVWTCDLFISKKFVK